MIVFVRREIEGRQPNLLQSPFFVKVATFIPDNENKLQDIKREI
jgi:hypothetical protein